MTFATFSSIQWIAFLIAALALIKLVVIMFNPKKWLDITAPLYKNSKAVSWISLILSFTVLYYLLQELSIVQIMASFAFLALLGAFAAMQYSNDLLAFAKKMMKKKFSGALWFYMLLWLVLSIWTFIELFS